MVGQRLSTNERGSSVVDAKLCEEGVLNFELGPYSPRQESCVTAERGNKCSFYKENAF